MLGSRRGVQAGFNTILSIVLFGFLLLVGVFTLITSNQGAPLGQAFESGINEAGAFVVRVAGPLANTLLGLDNASDTNIQFLMVMTFILAFIVIVGALDTVSLFGEERQGHLMNAFVAIIISIIGIRFMPADLWSSLTAPSSAFIVVILLGLPFAGVFVLSMKFPSMLARKLIWLLYVVFVGVLIYSVASSPYIWAYVTFLVLAIIMMAFDGTVRNYIRIEKAKLKADKSISAVDTQERIKIRLKLEELQKLKAGAEPDEIIELDKQMKALRTKLRAFAD